MSAVRSSTDAVDGSWRARAACSNLETDVFFPTGGNGLALEQTERAKSICQACPVRAECLEFAMDTNQPAGIFGGLTEDERRSLRRRRARQRRAAGAATAS